MLMLEPLHMLLSISLAFAASEVTLIVAIRGSSMQQLLQQSLGVH